MRRLLFTVVVFSFFGCEVSPAPAPTLEPDRLAADIAKLNADLLACRQAENDRLRKESAALDVEIAEAKARIDAYRSLVGEVEYRRIVGDGGAGERKSSVQP